MCNVSTIPQSITYRLCNRRTTKQTGRGYMQLPYRTGLRYDVNIALYHSTSRGGAAILQSIISNIAKIGIVAYLKRRLISFSVLSGSLALLYCKCAAPVTGASSVLCATRPKFSTNVLVHNDARHKAITRADGDNTCSPRASSSSASNLE